MKNQRMSDQEVIPTRRKFFKAFMGNFMSYFEESKGIKQMNLSNLKELPQEFFEKIVPVYCPYVKFKIKHDVLSVIDHKTNSFREVKKLESNERFIINHFGGPFCIKEIAERLASHNDEEYEISYEQVRLFFQYMAGQKICQPRDPHQKEENNQKKSN